MSLQDTCRVLDVNFGFSDHYINEAPAAAIAYIGGRIFEKHFKLDDSIRSLDSECSLSADKFKSYVARLNEIADLTTKGNSRLDFDLRVAETYSTSAFAARDMNAGDLLSIEDIIPLRTDNNKGINWNELYKELKNNERHVLARDVYKNQPIREEDVL
jgi:sialic acid synthase SpsE